MQTSRGLWVGAVPWILCSRCCGVVGVGGFNNIEELLLNDPDFKGAVGVSI